MKPLKLKNQNQRLSRHADLATKTSGMVLILLLTLAQGVLAQSTNGFVKSGALTPATNGVIPLDPVTVSLPDHTRAGTVTANISYPLTATANTRLAVPAAAAAAAPGNLPVWARGIATGPDGGDSSERDAHLQWVRSH